MSSKFSRMTTLCKLSVQCLPCRNQNFSKKVFRNEELTSRIFLRIFSTSTLHKYSIFKNQEKIDIDIPTYGQLLDSWYYDVKPFGRVQIHSPMTVHVHSLNPQKYPEMDKVFINILYTGNEPLSEQSLTAAKKQYIVSMNLDDTNEEIEVDLRYKTDVKLPAVFDIQIPIKYEVYVICIEDGDASLKNLEGSSIYIATDKGSCTCKNIKSGTINIRSRKGNILSKTMLQGNLSLTTNHGDIVAGRLQGQEVNCRSGSGDICIKSIYADKSKFTSKSGTVMLNSCHGNSLVDVGSGNLSVDTLDGTLKANVTSGFSNVYIAREGELDLNSDSGDIQINVPVSLNSTLLLQGKSVEEGEVAIKDKIEIESRDMVKVSGVLGEHTANAGKIVAVSKTGKIRLSYQDWLASLKFFKDP